MPLSFAVSIRLYQAALASAPAGLPESNQFLPSDHKRSNGSLTGVVVGTQQRAVQVAQSFGHCPMA